MKKLITLCLWLIPMSLFSQSYQLNLQGTRQIGKGSTGMAQPVDATALFSNPGSSVFLENNDITAGVTPAISSGEFTNAKTNQVSKTDNPVKTPFNLSASFGHLEGKWRYGISIYTPFGLTNAWKKDADTQFEALKMSLTSVSVQPTVSYKISDRLGIGAGFIYTYGHVNIRRTLPIQFQNGEFSDTQLKADGAYGFGVNAGLFYKVSDKVALALQYRSGIKMKADKGDANFNVPPTLEDNFPSQKFRAELPLPSIYGIGASYSPNDEWVINAEAFLSDWHNYDEITIHYKDAPVNGMDNTKLVRHYTQGYSFRGGAEYLPIGKKYELRAGFIVNLSPIPDDLLNPDVPDADRISPAIGGSYKFTDRLRADLTLLYEPVHRSGTNKLTGLDGTYNYDLIFPSIGITYKY